jgi:hypothetical protein
LGSFHETEGDSVLMGLSFGLGPSNVCYPLAKKPDDERIINLDFFGINGAELRDPRVSWVQIVQAVKPFKTSRTI